MPSREALALLGGRGEIAALGARSGCRPARSAAVLAPVEREGPARQRLARIPFALAVMQEAARREALAQPADQVVGADALGRAERVGVPFGRLVIVDRHEGRLAAHGEAHVLGDEIGIDRSPSASSAAQASSENG